MQHGARQAAKEGRVPGVRVLSRLHDGAFCQEAHVERRNAYDATCMAMMEKAGMSQQMMRRCRVMMRTPISMDSPNAIRGQAEALGLSEEQKNELAEIEKDARKKALAVLTPEQRKKMGEVPGEPMAMMQMCQQMCAKMMPMMQKMMGGKGMAYGFTLGGQSGGIYCGLQYCQQHDVFVLPVLYRSANWLECGPVRYRGCIAGGRWSSWQYDLRP